MARAVWAFGATTAAAALVLSLVDAAGRTQPGSADAVPPPAAGAVLASSSSGTAEAAEGGGPLAAAGAWSPCGAREPGAFGPAPSTRPEPLDARFDDDASLPAHADPVASYTMHVALDPDRHELTASGTITWRNASVVPQSELYVHLYLDAFRDAHTVFFRDRVAGFRGAGLPASFGRIEVQRFFAREMDEDLWVRAKPCSSEEPSPDEQAAAGADVDRTDMRVPLPRPVAPGERLTVDVAWTARLPSIVLRTGYAGSFHLVGQWFPKLARLEPDGRWAHFPFHRLSEFYADFGDYDVTIEVPAAFVVGATGALREEHASGGRVVRRFVQRDVHDFAFTAWDGFRVATEVVDGVEVRALFPDGYEHAARAELGAARSGLAHFSRYYGRYPYGTLTIVHPPEYAREAGGMEYPTFITTGGPWYAPLLGARALETVTMHELAHQWFCGLVATDEHTHPFLDEGLTTYAELDAMEQAFPGASAAHVGGVSLGLPAIYRAGSVGAAGLGSIARPAASFPSGYDYAALVYARTGTLFETLSRVFGRDEVRRALGRYARRHRFRHPGPDHLIAALGDAMGRDAACAAAEVLREGGWVDYRIDEITTERAPRAGGGGAAWRGEVLVRRLGPVRFPVEVAFFGEDGSVRRTPWDAAQPFARLPYEGSSPLAAAVVDPDRRVLLDEDLTNNARSLGARRRVSPRVLEGAAFAAGALLLAGPP